MLCRLKRRRLMSFSLVTAGAGAVLAWSMADAPSPAMIEIALIEPAGGGVVAAAPGWVEPVSEEVRLSAPLPGRLAEVPVEDGDAVARGQVIARLENAEHQAELDRAEATLRKQEAELARLVNGAREQERAEAAALVREAAAAVRTAEIVLERRRTMLAEATVGREDVDQAERDYLMARARHEAARERQELLNAPPRAEDVAVAEAEVAIARAIRDRAAAVLKQTYVRSPIDGIVLRRHMQSGETVLTSVDMPIVTVGDVSRLNIRADVDERDIGRIRIGQRGYVTAPAFGDTRFWGTVTQVGRQLGRKDRYTDEPKERTDAKVLQVIMELDSPDLLLPGLRVDTYFLAGEGARPADRRHPGPVGLRRDRRNGSAVGNADSPERRPGERHDGPLCKSLLPLIESGQTGASRIWYAACFNGMKSAEAKNRPDFNQGLRVVR